MPRYLYKELRANEIGVFLETNDTVSPAAFGVLLIEIEKLALDTRHFGPEAELRVLELGVGSAYAKIGIFVAGVAAVGAISSAYSAHKSAEAAMAQLELSIEDRAERSNSYLGQCLAEMYVDSSVTGVEITTSTGERYIKLPDLPAVSYVLGRRDRGIETRRSVSNAGARLPMAGRVESADNNKLVEFDQGGERKYKFQEQEPVRDGDGFRFERSGDIRGARSYLGKFSQGDDDTVLFVTEGGRKYGAIWDSDLEEYLGEVPFGQRVMVRAQLDRENQSTVIFEIYTIDQSD